MVSTNNFFHTPLFGFGVILLIYTLPIGFGVLVNVLLSEIWGETSDGVATARMTKFHAWLKRITFYEILIGMKATLAHLLHYQPVTFQYPYEKAGFAG